MAKHTPPITNIASENTYGWKTILSFKQFEAPPIFRAFATSFGEGN